MHLPHSSTHHGCLAALRPTCLQHLVACIHRCSRAKCGCVLASATAHAPSPTVLQHAQTFARCQHTQLSGTPLQHPHTHVSQLSLLSPGHHSHGCFIRVEVGHVQAPQQPQVCCCTPATGAPHLQLACWVLVPCCCTPCAQVPCVGDVLVVPLVVVVISPLPCCIVSTNCMVHCTPPPCV